MSSIASASSVFVWSKHTNMQPTTTWAKKSCQTNRWCRSCCLDNINNNNNSNKMTKLFRIPHTSGATWRLPNKLYACLLLHTSRSTWLKTLSLSTGNQLDLQHVRTLNLNRAIACQMDSFFFFFLFFLHIISLPSYARWQPFGICQIKASSSSLAPALHHTSGPFCSCCCRCCCCAILKTKIFLKISPRRRKRRRRRRITTTKRQWHCRHLLLLSMSQVVS